MKGITVSKYITWGISLYEHIGEFKHKGKTHEDYYVMTVDNLLDDDSLFPQTFKELCDLGEVHGFVTFRNEYMVEMFQVSEDWSVSNKVIWLLDKKQRPIAVHDQDGFFKIQALSECITDLPLWDGFKMYE